MKTIRLIVSAVFILGLMISCNQEVELFPDNVPDVLYVLGCLDGTGGIQQVKIRRMIHGNGDDADMINDPARYLPAQFLRVYLENASGEQFPLKTVLYAPQTGGPFRQDSNLIYELAGFTPEPGQACTLRIEDSLNGTTVNATIMALTPASITYPAKESVVHGKFDFTDDRRPFHVTYTSAPVTILTMSVKYMDFMIGGDSHCRKAVFSGLPSYYGYGLREYDLEYLTNIFKRLIPVDPRVDFRLFYRFDFSVWTGDGVISRYLNISNKYPDNRKFSADNMIGGKGLFYATSHDILKNVCPDNDFCKFLTESDSLKQLKFSRILYDGPYSDPDSSLANPFSSAK